eukprot:scaffold1738_cov46-Attheya_sp.AAC.3
MVMTESDDQEELPIRDLPNQVPTDTDRKLMGVYGDYMHQNDGMHLDGRITDDKIWQARWQKLVALPTKRYNAPGGHVGCQFLSRSWRTNWKEYVKGNGTAIDSLCSRWSFSNNGPKCNRGRIHPSTYPKPLEIVKGGKLHHAGARNSTGSNRNDPHECEHENPRATGKDFRKSNAAG